ncbi:MAG TPA: protein kinase, partial [Kofleriaceae bacterium]|nr:protein kinase [Kofleriaceae bacterium]
MSGGEKQFGPYRLVQQLAVGGMAEIHLAKTHGIAGFEKYVALKMIHPNYSQDQQFIQMLIDEAKITVQLQHVNIAQTFDLGRVGETYYITMEYVDGADLYKLLRKSAELDREIPIAVGCYIAKEVTSGLDYAHRKRDHAGRSLGIVHRDVSPQNVLISYAGEVKLVDFGIAKATSRARQTAVGVIKGKYYYMSPEQAWGESLDHRTDIFSSGILLYETLTGQMLYLEEDLHKLLEMVRRADIPPPSTIRKDIPAGLDRIVMRALAKRPEDRYQSAGDMANDLERFLHGHAPVFTAARVAGWLAEVLGGSAAPTLMGIDKQEAERVRNDTRRFTRDQLVHARSEFNDENSIIRDAIGADTGSGTDTGAETGGGRERRALDETSTYDSPLPDAGVDVDALPDPPRPGQAPTMSAGHRRPTEPEDVVAAARSRAADLEPPTLRRQALQGSSAAARLARPPTSPPSLPLAAPPGAA